MKVLVPLDGSVFAECMLAPALRLAHGGEIFLVRVMKSPADRAQRDAAVGYLEEHRKLLEGQGVCVRWDLEQGDPAERILVIARERAADCIAMATHGDSASKRSVRGSVAERVLRESSVPVVMVNPRGVPKTHQDFLQRLLVPLDGSPLSAEVLSYVEHLARTFGSEVVLLRVEPTAGFGGKRFDPDMARDALEPHRARLQELGVRANCMAVSGHEAEQILNAAQEVDMVCMSTHGRSGLSRWWFGSVAEQVLRACDRPLLVVRPSRP